MTTKIRRMARIHRLAMQGPDDTSAIQARIASDEIDPAAIVAILGKTEGNGCVNDFTRGYAVQSLHILLSKHLSVQQLGRICIVMSGGTEGALSPHWIVLEDLPGSETAQPGPSLALGAFVTSNLELHQLGHLDQVQLVADGVRQAMKEALIESPDDVHFVQIKCPLLTMERISAVDRTKLATTNTLKSMGLSRGASALGVGVALDELDFDKLHDGMIGNAPEVYSGRASTSAGVELMGHEILVMGMSQHWSGPLGITHTVMRDAIDMAAVWQALSCIGIKAEGQLTEVDRERIHAVLVKAEASISGTVRGARHTMLDDSDISSTRHARGFVAGVLSGLFGYTQLFVSGGAEHQGPDGGGPCAIIYDRQLENP